MSSVHVESPESAPFVSPAESSIRNCHGRGSGKLKLEAIVNSGANVFKADARIDDK